MIIDNNNNNCLTIKLGISVIYRCLQREVTGWPGHRGQLVRKHVGRDERFESKPVTERAEGRSAKTRNTVLM